MSIVQSGGTFQVVSKSGKPLSKKLKSFKAAAERLRQVEFFSKKKKNGKK